MLDEIGFAWKGDASHNVNQIGKIWHQQYMQLAEFKRKNGHCMVPQNYEQDASLGRWVSKQRNIYKNDKMRLDRKIILDEIGFAWRGIRQDSSFLHPLRATTEYDKLWNMQCKKLVEFKRKNGHCKVPSRYEQDKSLGQWVNKQRHFHINDEIRLDRKRILDEIGFAWNDEDAHSNNRKIWHHQHEKLVEFKRNHGNVKEDGGRVETGSIPSRGTSREVAQGETPGEIPSGWKVPFRI
jgi:hypothetical protein